MSTITSTRLTKKQTHLTNDVQCVRVELRNGEVIRVCDYDIDLTMSTRISRDGVSEALSPSVTYYSASAMGLTAVSESSNADPGSVDLEGLLDAVTTASGSTTTEYGYSVDSISASEDDSTNLAPNAIDGDDSTFWRTNTSIAPVNSFDGTYGSIYLQLNYDETIEVDLLRFSRSTAADPVEYWAVQISTDGSNFNDLIPMMNHSTNDGTFDITFPDTVRLRGIRLLPGPREATGSASQRSIYEVKAYRSFTGNNLGNITKARIASGVYDYARIYVFITDGENPVEDEEKWFTGFWGKATYEDGKYSTEFRSLIDVFNQRRGRFYNSQCDAVLGDNRCGVKLNAKEWSSEMFINKIAEDGDKLIGIVIKPTTQNGFFYKPTVISSNNKTSTTEPTWPTSAGSSVVDGDVTWTAIRAPRLEVEVASVASRTSFNVNVAGTYPNDYFKNGFIEFLTGDLAGLRFSIKRTKGNLITLRTKTPVDITVADTAVMIAGCQKRFSTDCKDKFDNFKNYQGFLNIPGNNIIRQFGGQR